MDVAIILSGSPHCVMDQAKPGDAFKGARHCVYASWHIAMAKNQSDCRTCLKCLSLRMNYKISNNY